jgi:hypothetical protein
MAVPLSTDFKRLAFMNESFTQLTGSNVKYNRLSQFLEMIQLAQIYVQRMSQHVFKKLEESVSKVPNIRLGSFLLLVIALIVIFTIVTPIPGIIFFLFSGLFLIVEGLHRSGAWIGWKYLIDWVFPDDLLRINFFILVKNLIIIIIRLSIIMIGLYLLSFGLAFLVVSLTDG